MTSVSVFGNGNMGTAIGGLLADGGAEVQYIGHGAPETVTGDLVVLAVPYEALGDIAAQYGDQFTGRVVVDITNPLDFDTFAALKVPAGSSAAAEVQHAIPKARVVKAFNTNFAATLTSRKVGSSPVTVLAAGDDRAAKQALVDLVAAAGLTGIDAGGLARAHELEAIGFLQLTLAKSGTIGWSGGFTLMP